MIKKKGPKPQAKVDFVVQNLPVAEFVAGHCAVEFLGAVEAKLILALLLI